MDFKKGVIIDWKKPTKPSNVKLEQTKRKRIKKTTNISSGRPNKPYKSRKLPERDSHGRFISSKASPPTLKKLIYDRIINDLSMDYGTQEGNRALKYIIDMLTGAFDNYSSDELLVKLEDYQTVIEPDLWKITYWLGHGHYQTAIEAASNLILVLTGELREAAYDTDELTIDNIVDGDHYDDDVYE